MFCRFTRALILSMLLLGGVLTSNPMFAMEADDAPETIEISILSELYEPVEFDHSMHVDIAECVDCHHHTTGTDPVDESCLKCHKNSEEADTVSCSECHTSKRFYPEDLQQRDADIHHRDKPGLKGAYHLNCLGCHRQYDAPIGCEDCHAMTEEGRALFKVSISSSHGNGSGEKHN